jgi:hypothetical protein
VAKEPVQPASQGPGAALARKWLAQIETDQKWSSKWRERSKRVIKRYKDERPDIPDQANSRKFAILWSNIQTLGPAVYARTPTAVVLRRYKDEDPTGREASEVLERAINYSLDAYDFDAAMKLCRDDYLLLALGQAWIRYEPHFKSVQTPVSAVQGEELSVPEDGVSISYEDESGTLYDPDEVEEKDGKHFITEERLEYEEVCCDHVAWDDFGFNPARTWDEVRYVWRRAPMSRAALKERFGEKGGQVTLDYSPGVASDDPKPNDDPKSEALIYEIWDKVSRKAIWVCKGYNDVLDERDDPLNLKDFFPCPRPLLGTTAQDSILPIPDYAYYQDQAEELNDLTAKIGRLTDVLRLVGFYSGEHQVELANIFKGSDNELVPVAGWQELKEGGGARGIIEWIPIEQVISTLQACVEARRQILEDIYQITGISDIVRGASDPNETATAQGIKAQWGSLRVRDRQKELARFARDIIRIKGEIIAEKFSPETLKVMTGVKLATNQEKQQLQMLMQAAQQPPQPGMPPQPAPPVPPDAEELLRKPSWEDVQALLQNDAMRTFRIDIEADSTIEPDEQEEKAARAEFVTAFGGFLAQALPVVEAAPPMGKIVAELTKWLVRGYRVGREMEDTIDSVVEEIGKMPPPQPEAQAPGPPPPDPADQQAKVMTAQARMVDAQTGQQQVQQDGQFDQADIMLRANQQQLDAKALARDPHPQAVRNG